MQTLRLLCMALAAASTTGEFVTPYLGCRRILLQLGPKPVYRQLLWARWLVEGHIGAT